MIAKIKMKLKALNKLGRIKLILNDKNFYLYNLKQI